VSRIRRTDGQAVNDRIYNVLFLCTGNSARTIIGEAIINHRSRGQFKGFSAGSHPRGSVHPIALELLDRMHISHEGARSKDWSEFAQPGAPVMVFVFTVCDRAAAELCPVWPGQPMTAQWAVEDPVLEQGSETAQCVAFRHAFRILDTRIKLLLSLPVASLDRIRLQQSLDDIGASKPAPDEQAT
jgi:arsenate reductase